MNGYLFATNFISDISTRSIYLGIDMTSKTKYSLISNIQSTCYGQNNHIDLSERKVSYDFENTCVWKHSD